MVRRVGEKGAHMMGARNQAVSKTFREQNGLSPTGAASKWFSISGHGVEREHLLNAVLFSEFGRLLV